MNNERLDCRLCHGDLTPRLSLPPTPIANEFAKAPDTAAVRYPLDLMQCDRCSHVQLRHIAGSFFEEYKYATPQAAIPYLKSVAKLMKERFPDAKEVLEIGSNNGINIRILRDAGFEAVGIDPSATGDYNVKGYFTAKWAAQLATVKKVDLVIANNVFAHIDDMHDIFCGIDAVLSKNGAVVFEVQYFHDLVDTGAFDMIYHEHLSYHTITPLANFLRKHYMVITCVDRIPTHGGSIRVTAQRLGTEIKHDDAAIDWQEFKGKIEQVKNCVREILHGRKVVLLGAAAKVTTMIHACGIADNILFACDDAPQKIGLYVPGTNIVIKPTSELKGYAALLGAWNFEKQLRERFPKNELINPFREVALCV